MVHFKHVLKTDGKIQEPCNEFIGYGNITACLVCHMHFVSLVVQAHKCAAHADDVIIRVRGEDQRNFRKRFMSFRMR